MPENGGKDGTEQRFHSTGALLRAMVAPPAFGAVRLLEPDDVVAGRYRVEGAVGQGGMGVVYLAADEQLDRRVALKLQHRTDVHDAKRRLVREAQALARLSHPNVVTVHEVGEYDGNLFIAMEYVDGETLDQWLRRPHTVRDILHHFIEAGRGLAAAHAVGLVHRDVKPGNILIGRDGRARVADFGLAMGPSAERSTPAAEPRDRAEPKKPAQHDGGGAEQTRFIGTPAYMAPEQIRGEAIDAGTDQFAYCVALYEAVTGRRPFEAETFEAVLQRIVAGDHAQAGRARRMPRWLERALGKGLAADPADRFPTMDALLADLEAGPRRVRRRGLALGFTAALLLVGVTAATLSAKRMECRGAGGLLAEVWNDQQRQALATAFGASGLPYAAKSAQSVAAVLDGWANRWSAERIRACEASRVYGEQTRAALDLRTGCLDRRLGGLRVLVSVLTRSEKPPVAQAAELAGTLEAPEGCADIERLGRVLPLPADAREEEAVATARHKITEARLLARAGRFDDAQALLDAVSETVKRGYMPLRAESAYALADLRARQSKFRDAERWYEEAARCAAAAGDDDLLLKVNADFAFRLADYRAADERIDALLDLARATWERTGRDPEQEAHLAGNTSYARSTQGRYPEAVAAGERAVQLREAGGDPAALGNALTTLGKAMISNGDGRRARSILERAVALSESALGLEHPRAQRALSALTLACQSAGDYDAALRHATRAAEAVARLHGPDSPQVADYWSILGVMLMERGQTDAARPYVQRALEIARKAYEPDSSDVGFFLGNLSVQLATEEHWQEALPFAIESRDVLRRALGDSHPVLVNADCILGTIERGCGDTEASAKALRAALRRADRVLEPGHPDRLNPRVELARTELARGRIDDAVRLADEALRLAQSDRTPARMRPDVWFAVAETRWAKGVDKASALDYARKAMTAWRELGYVREIAKAEAWLAERSASSDPREQMPADE